MQENYLACIDVLITVFLWYASAISYKFCMNFKLVPADLRFDMNFSLAEPPTCLVPNITDVGSKYTLEALLKITSDIGPSFDDICG